MMKKSYEMDMCNGPIFRKILVFAIPLMLSGVLQLLFNAADIVVVGQFTGSQALAAVGSTGALINLLINIFIGMSIGANVLVARYYGAQEYQHLSQTVHTAVLLSLLSGVALAVVGVAAAPVLLSWMGTPADVLDQAVLYMRIYFAGMPVIMLYNFGSAILRAVGDTKRPLYFLFIAGLVNVGLNLFFVIVWHMGVAGVALATVLSQIISAALVLACLVRSEAGYRVNLKKLHIYKDKFLQIVKIGVPAGIQGAMFSISNVLIQSSINSFGSIAMAGNTAASNIEGFVYTSMNAIYQTGLSFTSQNMGAKNYPRINRILLECVGIVTVAGLVMGWVALLFGHSLLGIYSSDQEVITYGINRMWVICSTYFVCGIMDLVSGFLRGMGYSMMPTLVSLTGVCGLRVLWIFTVFAWNRSLFMLYLSYPISWVITGVAHLICYVWGMRKLKAKQAAEAPLAQPASI